MAASAHRCPTLELLTICKQGSRCIGKDTCKSICDTFPQCAKAHLDFFAAAAAYIATLTAVFISVSPRKIGEKMKWQKIWMHLQLCYST